MGFWDTCDLQSLAQCGCGMFLSQTLLLQVQAHGGGLLKVKDTWYWFGESYKRPLLDDFLSVGVNLYSSNGEDQPCTCLLPHMRPRSCGVQPFTMFAGSSSTPGVCQAICICAEPDYDRIFPLVLPCRFGTARRLKNIISDVITGSAVARALMGQQCKW